MNRVYAWKAVGGMGWTAALAIIDEKIYFSNDVLSESVEGIGHEVSARQLETIFSGKTKVVEISAITKIRLCEDGTHFKIFHNEGKIPVVFGDGQQAETAEHFRSVVNDLDGFEVTEDVRAHRMENLDKPFACLLSTVLFGGFALYALYGDDIEPSGKSAFIAMFLQKLVRFLGAGVIWTLVLIGLWVSLSWLRKRLKRPLRAFIAKKTG